MKVAKMEISADVLTAIFTQGDTVYMASKGLPIGAKLLNVFFDPTTRLVSAVFTHNDFNEVKDGSLAPSLPFEITAMVPDPIVKNGRTH